MSVAPSPLPSWARFIPESEGRWKRRWLDVILRLVVKRKLAADADLAALRANSAGMDVRFASVEPGMRRMDVDSGGVRAEWVALPGSRDDRVILYLHGGAFMFRFPALHAGFAARICRRLGARALLPDYRLAPEDPYPAGVDDCIAAYRWLLAQGIPATNIVLAGDSAGANLVLATLHRLRDAGDPLPACAAAMSTVVDFTLSSPSLVANERRDPMFTLRGMLALRRMYTVPERFLDPGVSPLFGDFAGLPPLLFQAGSTEMLLDESVRCAVKAHAAGVPVALEIYERMPHAFQALPSLPMSEIALDSLAAFVRGHAGWAV